ncbi:4Fe-4S dicluster domain-containing protein [bacterium]|nr:4Fe-4S dicluster domain-containing protein [bacterium]
MGYFRRIYDVSKSILIGMSVTLKHMLTQRTLITKQYVGLKTPVHGRVGKVLGVMNDYGTDSGHMDHGGCLVCLAAKKLGISDNAHVPTKDPDAAYAVYERYYRPETPAPSTPRVIWSAPMPEPRPLDYLPPRHRGLHYLETEKCIMCFQCSRACPVDCIDIEGTRDGDLDGCHRGDKVNLTRFTIDYALCIFCDHCTLACPDKQVCIHMGKEFDLTSYDQGHLVKNLLTDAPFSKDDRTLVMKHRAEIDRLADEKKKAREAAKAAAAAAKKPAAPPAAAPPAAPPKEEKK